MIDSTLKSCNYTYDLRWRAMDFFYKLKRPWISVVADVHG